MHVLFLLSALARAAAVAFALRIAEPRAAPVGALFRIVGTEVLGRAGLLLAGRGRSRAVLRAPR